MTETSNYKPHNTFESYIVTQIQHAEISYDQTLNTHTEEDEKQQDSHSQPNNRRNKSLLHTSKHNIRFYFKYLGFGFIGVVHLQVQGLSHLQSDPHLHPSFSAKKVSPEASY